MVLHEISPRNAGTKLRMYLADRHGNRVQRDVLQQHITEVPKLDIRAAAAAAAAAVEGGEAARARWARSDSTIEALALKADAWQLHRDKALLMLAPEVFVKGNVTARERAGRESRWVAGGWA
jgi:hypothetical protein